MPLRELGTGGRRRSSEGVPYRGARQVPALHRWCVRRARLAGSCGSSNFELTSSLYTFHFALAKIVPMPRILVTNDDGVHSEGIKALADALRPFGDITVVAPIQEASA